MRSTCFVFLSRNVSLHGPRIGQISKWVHAVRLNTGAALVVVDVVMCVVGVVVVVSVGAITLAPA